VLPVLAPCVSRIAVPEGWRAVVVSPAGARARGPVASMAVWTEAETLGRIAEGIARKVSECPGRDEGGSSPGEPSRD